MRVCRQGVFDNMHWSICLSQSQAVVNQCRHADSSLHARPMSEHVVIKGTKMDEGLKLILIPRVVTWLSALCTHSTNDHSQARKEQEKYMTSYIHRASCYSPQIPPPLHTDTLTNNM